jgi:hypothetical protein
MSALPSGDANALPYDDARWRLYPDGDGTAGEPAAAAEQAARDSLRRGQLRGVKLVAVGVLVGIVAWQVSPLLFVAMFLGVVGWAMLWHVRHRRVVQAAFEQWCARRGLTQVGGQISSLYPRPAADDTDQAAARLIDACEPGGSVTVQCQLAGRLWAASPPGRVSRVRTFVGSDEHRSTREYVVIEVVLDPSIASSWDPSRVTPVGTTASGWDGAESFVDSLVSQLERVDESKYAVSEGRFFCWYRWSFAFYEAAMAIVAKTGELRSASSYVGADVMLDARIADARDHYRALVERRA